MSTKRTEEKDTDKVQPTLKAEKAIEEARERTSQLLKLLAGLLSPPK
jgi:hypothetical protein